MGVTCVEEATVLLRRIKVLLFLLLAIVLNCFSCCYFVADRYTPDAAIVADVNYNLLLQQQFVAVEFNCFTICK